LRFRRLCETPTIADRNEHVGRTKTDKSAYPKLSVEAALSQLALSELLARSNFR
jgi:hypothetical protein